MRQDLCLNLYAIGTIIGRSELARLSRSYLHRNATTAGAGALSKSG
jgi:hypothetical protein